MADKRTNTRRTTPDRRQDDQPIEKPVAPAAKKISCGNVTLDWGVLVPHLVHPTKVWIIEAMLWIDRPLSASELERVFDLTLSLSRIAYHVKSLVKGGMLRQVDKHQIRGAWKRMYVLSAP